MAKNEGLQQSKIRKPSNPVRVASIIGERVNSWKLIVALP